MSGTVVRYLNEAHRRAGLVGARNSGCASPAVFGRYRWPGAATGGAVHRPQGVESLTSERVAGADRPTGAEREKRALPRAALWIRPERRLFASIFLVSFGTPPPEVERQPVHRLLHIERATAANLAIMPRDRLTMLPVRSPAAGPDPSGMRGPVACPGTSTSQHRVAWTNAGWGRGSPH
jgi:hypothetical protein